MDYTTLSLLLGGVILLIFYVWHHYNYWSKRGIPSAKGTLPLIGNLFPVILLKESFSEYCRRIYNENPGRSMVGFYNLTTPVLLVRDPELVKTILQSQFPNFHKNAATVVPELDPLIARNPFFASGEEWLVGRKRLTYAFSNMKLKVLFETVIQVCTKLDNYVEKRLQSSDKYEVELKNLFSKFTGEVVANAGLGIEGHCFEDEPHPASLQRMGNSFLEPTMTTGFNQGLVFVLPQLTKLLKMPFVPKEVDTFFRTAVKEVLECRRKETVPRNDFLQLMVEMEKMEGEKLNEDVIASDAFSFFLDGYETSSITLTFVGYQLACHQDIQDKLRDEINQVCAKHGGAITYESLDEMKYMKQVINESQRLYPAVGTAQKLCTKEYELTGSDGITYRAAPGTKIFISSHGIQMDPNIWADPEKFDPERFNEERKKDIHRFTFLPFGEGPRMCVGMRMAMVQMRACLASLLLKYRLDLSPKTQIPIKLSPYSILSYPIGGAWVNIRRL